MHRVWLHDRARPDTRRSPLTLVFFFFNDTATTEIYTLSLHDALPIFPVPAPRGGRRQPPREAGRLRDRKSTRLNSSHGSISYAVFCLKKKKTYPNRRPAFITDLIASAHSTLTTSD